MTPEEERLERLAKRIAALNRADAAMHAAMQDEPADDDPETARSES
ncbi:hypothetical protein [Nonomuraea sp. NPDC050643]